MILKVDVICIRLLKTPLTDKVVAGRTLLVLFRPAFKYAQGQDDEIPTKGSKFKLITPDFEAGKTESEAGFSNNSRTFLAPDASVFVQESFVIDVIV